MENTYFEFQAKGSHAPVFDLIVPDWDPKNIMGPNRKLVLLKDGERIIAKVVDSVLNTFTNETYMQIEDVDGNKATISSKLAAKNVAEHSLVDNNDSFGRILLFQAFQN